MGQINKPQSVSRTTKKTVFIVDDHPLLRQGLGLLVNREPDLVVCGEAEEAQAAMREIAAKNPDILIARYLAEWPGRTGTPEKPSHAVSEPSRLDPLHARRSRSMPSAPCAPVPTATS